MNSVQLVASAPPYCGIYLKDLTLSLDNIEIAYQNEGDIISHDLLEHLEGVENIGDPINELKALGAVWYIRGENSTQFN